MNFFRPRRTSSSSRPPAPYGPIPAGPPREPPLYYTPPQRQHYQPVQQQRPTHRATKYDSDTELLSSRRVYAPPPVVAPTSITPHPGDRASRSRDRAGAAAPSSRSRNTSQNLGPPLKSCLKPPKAPLDMFGFRPSQPPRSVVPPYQDHSQNDSLESRHHRVRRESAPSARYGATPAMPSSTRLPTRRGSDSSETSNEIPTRHVERATRRGHQADQPIALHWVLANKFQTDARYPPIYFDVAWNPAHRENIRGLTYKPHLRQQVNEPVPEVYLQQEASMNAPMTSMIIYCPRGVLGDAPVQVTNPSGITCIDVFNKIFDAYRSIIPPNDHLQVGQDEYERCSKHFKARCRDSPKGEAYEERLGMRYVDLLRGATRRCIKGLKQRRVSNYAHPSFDLHFEDI